MSGKTILVTGASSGIGRATAVWCSRLGATLVITGRNAERLDATLSDLHGDGHRCLTCDLAVTEEVDRLVAETDSLDGVVLCAGIGFTLPFQFGTTAKIADVMSANFFSPTELLRLLVKKKRLKRGASVVAVSSMGGTHFFTVGNSAYGASKAALESMMRFAAKELAPKRIRVNTVLPAMIDTPLIHRGAVSDEEHAADAATYPLKRYGRPEEVAYAIVYLLSDAAAWVTGTSMVIDGGKSLV